MIFEHRGAHRPVHFGCRCWLATRHRHGTITQRRHDYRRPATLTRCTLLLLLLLAMTKRARQRRWSTNDWWLAISSERGDCIGVAAASTVRQTVAHCFPLYCCHSTLPVKQEVQLSPRDSREALCQMKRCPSFVRITHTDPPCQPEEHFQQLPCTLYSATCIVLYTHRCSRLNYRTASMRCRACHRQTFIQPCWCQLDCNCDHQTSTTIKLVDNTAYSSTSAPTWTRSTVADGHKFSAVCRLSRRFLDRSKTQFLPTSLAFGSFVA